MTVKDYFSAHSADYQRYRPGYPAELFDYLALTAPALNVALDVGTGNGQAAAELARHFALVLAGDPSANQLKHAVPNARVSYVRHAAERLPVRSAAVDLLAVAQAAHWFDFAPFYAEARRVVRPGGIVALFTYSLFRVDAVVDALVDRFYRDRVGRYWPPERRYVDEHYRSLPFPLEELPAPKFRLEVSWPREALLSYVGTWSAVERCRAASGVDPVPELAAALAVSWPAGTARKLHFPIHLRIGRV